MWNHPLRLRMAIPVEVGLDIRHRIDWTMCFGHAESLAFARFSTNART